MHIFLEFTVLCLHIYANHYHLNLFISTPRCVSGGQGRLGMGTHSESSWWSAFAEFNASPHATAPGCFASDNAAVNQGDWTLNRLWTIIFGDWTDVPCGVRSHPWLLIGSLILQAGRPFLAESGRLSPWPLAEAPCLTSANHHKPPRSIDNLYESFLKQC